MHKHKTLELVTVLYEGKLSFLGKFLFKEKCTSFSTWVNSHKRFSHYLAIQKIYEVSCSIIGLIKYSKEGVKFVLEFVCLSIQFNKDYSKQ